MTRVMVFGSFDILHPGHLNLFRQARRYGNRLYVVIARDKNIRKIKGRSPVYDENARKQSVEKIKFVDLAVLGDIDDPYKIIEKVNPDVICLGYDQNSFTMDLGPELRKRGLNPRVVRLRAHRSHRYKSSKLRK